MNVSRTNVMVTITCLAVSIVGATSAEGAAATLSDRYPGVTSGALSFATLGELPEGVLLKSGEIEVTSAELAGALGDVEAGVKGQLDKNKLFLLENLATREFLIRAARESEGADGDAAVPEKELIQKYLERVVAGLQVTDAEVALFYEQNKDMCGGASLDEIKGQLGDYVLGQKKQDAVTEHVRTMGQRAPIVLAAHWVEAQAKLSLANPVDKARASGKPSVVDFGATGCRPCDMMAPILETLKSKYDGKVNVLFIHVREEQILASRYGIQSIPVQVFFDKEGKEVYRHTGFYPQDEIEKRLAGMEVR